MVVTITVMPVRQKLDFPGAHSLAIGLEGENRHFLEVVSLQP